MQTADGIMKWLEIRVQQQSDAQELAGIITNVTNSYRIEAEKDARMQAERHLRLKNALLSNMSHEIRTPVAAIMSSSEILHEEIDPSLKEFTTMIRDGGSRLLSLLDNILLFSQAQSNNIAPSISTFDLLRTIDQIVSPLNPQHVSLNVEGPATLSLQSDQYLVTTILKCLDR